MKSIVNRLCGRLFGQRWRWRSDLVNNDDRIWRGDLLFITWNDVGGRLLMLRMSDGRGTSRSRFLSGNVAGIRFFIMNRALVGSS